MNIRRVNRIDELAQSLPPARDLWPAIVAAIEADRAAAAVDSAPRRTRWLPAVGMAAAVALVTIGIFIGRGDRKSTRLNSSHTVLSRMPSSA